MMKDFSYVASGRRVKVHREGHKQTFTITNEKGEDLVMSITRDVTSEREAVGQVDREEVYANSEIYTYNIEVKIGKASSKIKIPDCSLGLKMEGDYDYYCITQHVGKRSVVTTPRPDILFEDDISPEECRLISEKIKESKKDKGISKIFDEYVFDSEKLESYQKRSAFTKMLDAWTQSNLVK